MNVGSVTTKRRLREESGQGLVEYALILALVSLAAIVALGFLSGKINALFSKAGNSLNTVSVADGSGSGGTATGGTATGGTATGGTATGGTATGGGPVINITQQPPDPSSSSTATFQFTSSPAGTSYSCQVTGAGGSGPAPCSASTPITYNGLGNGSHTFSVTPTPAGTPDSFTWTINAAAVPTPGTVTHNTCGGTDCDENETLTATVSGWNANGSPITGYFYEWYARSDDNCSDGGSWGSVDDRDPNSGTTTSLSETYDLPSASDEYTVKVRVYAVNAVGTSTAFAEDCTEVDA
jgi:Flp pilus assembly pilin Flp